MSIHMSTKWMVSGTVALLAWGSVVSLAAPAGADSAREAGRYGYDRYPGGYGTYYEAYRAAEVEGARVRVEVLVEGVPSIVYRDAGYRWIEGRRGQRFALRFTNQNPFAVGVIPSADGQSLTADGRAGANHPAYVIAPYGNVTISLWRENLRGGRELMFTDIDRSLAALKGDRRNLGVLGVLVWQLEDRQRPVPLDQGPYYPRYPGDARSSERAHDAAPGTSPGAARAESEARARGDLARRGTGLGIGAGGHVTDHAYLTNRYRRVRVLGTLSLYYDDRQGLMQAGVDLNQYWRSYPQPYAWEPYDRRQSNPFPQDTYRGVRIPN